MSRNDPHPSTRRVRGATAHSADAALDEACFLAELRLAVEGARTAAEERLARALPGWGDRMSRICARYAGTPTH
ncbi:hypothetical protein [Amaricoccus sp.]|uniref:hypothetical protein n=1 Tax=Amaricoccus sp. TaxID=1872485 RepID=UPI001B5C28C5|nr:hypothetical protein [Amaricoccus sp.]MBP7000568.1 hypothetical protein [Amaricoccus sp.]